MVSRNDGIVEVAVISPSNDVGALPARATEGARVGSFVQGDAARGVAAVSLLRQGDDNCYDVS